MELNFHSNLKLTILAKELCPYLKSRRIEVYLDLGCGNGVLTAEISRIIGAKTTYGVDIDEEALSKAQLNGIKVFKCDLSRDALPLPDKSVDIVTALNVIEHLLNPDHMLKEAYRVLKKEGLLVITTPNMASWYNRLLLLLGQPILGIDLSTEYRYLYPLGVEQVISGHVRLYTIKALKDLVEYHGFKVVKIKGFPHDLRKIQNQKQRNSSKGNFLRR